MLTGSLTTEGFKATDMTAKCPSKYEAAPTARRAADSRSADMASLGYYLLLAASSSARTRPRFLWPVPGAARRALIESGVGAFYLVTAIMAAASAVIVYAFVTGDYSIKYVQRYSDSASRSSTSSRRTGAGSTARSCSGCPCCRSSAAIAVYVNRERHRELIPYVVAVISVGGDVLPLPDGRAQQPVRRPTSRRTRPTAPDSIRCCRTSTW